MCCSTTVCREAEAVELMCDMVDDAGAVGFWGMLRCRFEDLYAKINKSMAQTQDLLKHDKL